MLDTALILMAPQAAAHLYADDSDEWADAGLGAYPTAGVFVLGTPTPEQNRRLWLALRADGHPTHGYEDLATFEDLRRHAPALTRALGEIFRTRTADDWEQWAHDHGLAGERVQTLNEAVTQEQVRHRPLFQSQPDGDPTVPVAAFTYDHDGPHLTRRSPGFGEHTDQILEELGTSPQEIKQLRAAGVI